MVIVLIGPMGCGKTTVGRLLSSRLGWRFEDGDDFHPEANRRKMNSGIPLDDDDRYPWLQKLRSMLEEAAAQDDDLILACSALKRQYRRLLGIDQKRILSVYLKADRDLLRQRVQARSHQFMNKGLVDSQLATLEEPETGLQVAVDGTPEEVVEQIVQKLAEQSK